MIPRHTCTTARSADGTVLVDGAPYPMAASVVATEDVIQKSIQRMAQQLAAHYLPLTHHNSHPSPTHTSTAASLLETEAPISLENPLILISILKGSYIFTADLVRYLHDAGLPHVCDFVRLTSYNAGTRSTGRIETLLPLKYTNLKNKHVLIVEDVCDSGQTLAYFKDYIQTTYQPKTLRTLVLVDKEASARKVKFEADWAVLKAPNAYIIGYGFEVNDRYRDFRHIFVLKDGEAGRYPAKL